MEPGRKRAISEVLKRGYSDEEVNCIYELARFFLENGDLRRAEVIFQGLIEVAPDYAPGWLGMAYIQVQNKEWDAAIGAARAALRVEPRSAEALLCLAACLLTQGDFHTAGTYIGEVSDLIENGAVENQSIVRFYKAQLTRYQSRA